MSANSYHALFFPGTLNYINGWSRLGLDDKEQFMKEAAAVKAANKATDLESWDEGSQN